MICWSTSGPVRPIPEAARPGLKDLGDELPARQAADLYRVAWGSPTTTAPAFAPMDRAGTVEKIRK